MNNLKELLTNNMNPQVRLMAETRGLQGKWEKTGLLEGLEGIEKANMSILLESQAKQLLDEATATGTSANSEQWAGVALPLVRRVFAEISAKEFVSVQPMNLPSGLIFYLDFKYGTNVPTASVSNFSGSGNSSLFGGSAAAKYGSTDAATGGLYGVGRYGYTQKYQSTTLTNVTAATASVADLDYDAAYTSSTLAFTGYRLQVGLGSNTGSWDLNAIRSFTLSGSNINPANIIPEFTEVYNTGSLASPYYQVQFILSGSTNSGLTATGNTATVYGDLQPADTSRGDFEDKFTPYGNGYSNDIGIPEVNLVLNSEPIVAKTRKLKAVWTPELAQDLNAYHSIDAEAELTALLSEYVSMEIDLEILDMLITAAPYATTEAWSAQIGVEFTGKAVGNDGQPTWNYAQTTTNRTAYVKSTWFQTLGNKIQKVSNRIHQLTLRGGANFIVCGPDVATVLESIPGYVVNTDGDSAKFAMGVSRVGSFASRFQVYKNPYMQENTLLLGFRGNNFLETGAVYAPYIPLVQTPLVYDPVNFTPRRGVMTRYAKKVVRPEFFGKIYISDLDQV
jgi:Major capsid protein Gp23